MSDAHPPFGSRSTVANTTHDRRTLAAIDVLRSELRTALAQAYNAAGLSIPIYADPILTPGLVVNVAHIAEIRTAVANLP